MTLRGFLFSKTSLHLKLGTVFRAAGFGLSLCALAPSPALAQDSVFGMRNEDLSEVEHRVTVTMQPGYATLVVKRTVFNPGTTHDQATFDIFLPEGAVAVGLRTLGAQNGRPHWFDGELLEAEEAAKKYQELTGIGGYYPKDPALLSWRTQNHLKLQVFPCPPQERKSIEYTLIVPTTYQASGHELTMASLGTEELPARLELGSGSAKGRVLSQGRKIAPGTLITKNGEGSYSLRFEEEKNQDIGLSLATASTGDGRMVQRVDVRVGRLSEVPKNLDIVVAIDRSRSVDEATLAGMMRSLRAYLRSAGSAQVSIVSFARTARMESQGFLPASQAELQLGALTLPRENGSNVEGALSLASEILRAHSSTQQKRIVLLTDTLTSSQTTKERLEGIARQSGALLHIGVPQGLGESSLDWARDNVWAKVAESTGGLVWSATLPDEDRVSEDAVRVFEEWARPLRLRDVRVGVNTRAPLAEGLTLSEGDGFQSLGLEEQNEEDLYLRGRLWARQVARGARSDKKSGDLWAALALGSSVLGELSEPEMFVLAKRGNAVSPVTSFLAIEPGVRPSTEGIDWAELNGVGVGLGGMGMGRVRMGATKVGNSFNHDQYLQDLVLRHWQTCGGRGAAGVNFETTYEEIVAVMDVSGIESRDEVAEKCLTEALWQEALPAGFDESFATFAIVAQ